MTPAERARALLGTRFRLHGRDADGLDCVGVAALAHGVAAPTGYPLRGGRVEQVGAVLDAMLKRGDGEQPGDVLLMRTGPGQLHLGIRTDSGLVHADAGLRRVVERPGPPPWPVLGAWRALVCQASADAEAPHQPSPPPDLP